MTWMEIFSRPETLVFLVPIVAILVGGMIGGLKILFKHRERIAMIENGMHPDEPMNDPDASPQDDEYRQ